MPTIATRRPAARAVGQRAVLREHDQLGVDPLRGVGDGGGVVLAHRDEVAEPAVRGHVAHARPVVGGEGLQGAELVDDVGAHLLGGEVHRSPTEAAEVGEAGVGADADSALHARSHRGIHDPRIAGVEAARDVGRAEDVEERFVVPHAPGAEALTEVRDEIDLPAQLLPPILRRDRRVTSCSQGYRGGTVQSTEHAKTVPRMLGYRVTARIVTA